jgi:uncharacterized phage-like protein YoqJ
MKLAVTGHRPTKIGGYDPNNPIRVAIREWLEHQVQLLKPSTGISGMALGVDQDFAKVCIAKAIPLIAAIPFVGQENAWPDSSRRVYYDILKKAKETVVVCQGGYAASKMQKRNEWMVDNCDVLLAVWDGTSGGTSNCVRYATKVKRLLIRIDGALLAPSRARHIRPPYDPPGGGI